VFASRRDGVAARHLALRGHFRDGFFDGPAEIASAHAVFDRDVALIGLAINFGGAIARLNSAELREGDTLAGRREQANILNSFPRVAVMREIAKNEVIASLAEEHLS